MLDLLGMFDAFELAEHALEAAHNRPRCKLNSIGSNYIEVEVERLSWLSTDVAEEVSRRPPDEDPERRTEILVRWVFRTGSFTADDQRLRSIGRLIED